MQIDNVTLLHIAEPGLQIHLRYSGPLVDDGTIPLEDVVKALQGFAGDRLAFCFHLHAFSVAQD
jgi:hypothetical protein